MGTDKRRYDGSVPVALEDVLNEMQKLALRQMERFGWQLLFIRRPLFQEPIPVVFSADGEKIGILEDDGRVNMHPDIEVRK
jgi:hypothetical protein